MASRPLLTEAQAGKPRYTHLFASISEEDGGYTVQVRLYHEMSPRNAAWGEELADSFESASMLIAGLAAEFSIAQAHIEIEIRLDELAAGTRH